MTFMQRLFILILLASLSEPLFAVTKNGFDLSDSLIAENKIRQVGPPRDGISSIDEPRFINANAASFLHDKDRGIGVRRNRITKAYPIKILNWHEIVNGSFAGEFILVSYCPLCNTGMVFATKGLGGASVFGLPWLLYNSDMCYTFAELDRCGRSFRGNQFQERRREKHLNCFPLLIQAGGVEEASSRLSSGLHQVSLIWDMNQTGTYTFLSSTIIQSTIQKNRFLV